MLCPIQVFHKGSIKLDIKNHGSHRSFAVGGRKNFQSQIRTIKHHWGASFFLIGTTDKSLWAFMAHFVFSLLKWSVITVTSLFYPYHLHPRDHCAHFQVFCPVSPVWWKVLYLLTKPRSYILCWAPAVWLAALSLVCPCGRAQTCQPLLSSSHTQEGSICSYQNMHLPGVSTLRLMLRVLKVMDRNACSSEFVLENI